MKKKNPAPQVDQRRTGSWIAPTLALLFLATLTVLAALDRLHVAVPAVYAAMSVMAFAFYSLDKSAARTGGPRVRERNLHGLAALGGWPGAVAAQALLRHKTRKTGFLAVSWMTAAMHVAALGWWLGWWPRW